MILQLDPFPYGFVSEAFPEAYYQEMVARFPGVELGSQIKGQNKIMLEGTAINDPFWRDFTDSLGQGRWRIHFSWLRGSGGFIPPHTDSPDKVFAMVVPIVDRGEWQKDWGGQSLILRMKPGTDEVLTKSFDDFELVAANPFEPNTYSFLVKTFNSWHGVYPCKGPEGTWRRSITINFMR